MSFANFDLIKPVDRAICDLGFETPSDIQVKAIPMLRERSGDFVGQAQTGTGKTAAFVIPLLEKVDTESDKIQALIITPTRELANQVHVEVEKLSKYMTVKSTTVYGGVPYEKQMQSLKKDRPQIVVGTPGRIIDLIRQRVLKLKDCSTLVIDEADEMLNMGFIEDVQTIIDSLGKNKRMWMFSATMPDPIVKMIREKFHKPQIVKIAKQTLSNADVEQFFCVLKKKHFTEALMRVLQTTPDCYGMIFCETRHETKELADFLLLKGISVVSLHGELSQSQRDFAMKKFKDKKAKLLVCTDVAARGIDVNCMTHVFNMGLPRQDEAYVHRIGRTGRAGMKGISITFALPGDMFHLRRIERLTGAKIKKLELPHPNEIKKVKIFSELDKMKSLKGAIVDKHRAFQVDSSYKYFQSYFEDLSKEQVLQLLFSYQFNKEIRQLNDSDSLEVEIRSPRNFKKQRARQKPAKRENRRRKRY